MPPVPALSPGPPSHASPNRYYRDVAAFDDLEPGRCKQQACSVGHAMQDGWLQKRNVAYGRPAEGKYAGGCHDNCALSVYSDKSKHCAGAEVRRATPLFSSAARPSPKLRRSSDVAEAPTPFVRRPTANNAAPNSVNRRPLTPPAPVTTSGKAP